METVEGIMRCSRYSFGPNRLHYCGPDANKELRELIEKDGDNFSLSHLLQQFKTLFPYLKQIAHANSIQDPFDSRVVEAYWLGNDLLENIERQALHDFFVDDLRIKDKLKPQAFDWLREKIKRGALPHHSFHVLNIWTMEGHTDALSDLERMNECRISAGTVTAVNGPEITVSTEPVIFTNNQFGFGEPISKTITRQLECEYDIEQIKPGQIISIHWSTPCEIITKKQEEALKKYNLKSLSLANLSL